ncbi:MAG: ChaN family lipoprotein [Verrucomicrobiota bacterium]
MRALAGSAMRGVAIVFGVGLLWVGNLSLRAEEGADRASFWIDLSHAEPVTFEEMVEDLGEVDVVFLGETHRLKRHHRLQREIVAALAETGRPLIVGLEQIESGDQAGVDRFNSGELDFEGLVEVIEWEKQWRGYENYRGLVEGVREAGGRVVGLNGPLEVIRAVGRGGVDGLSEEDRAGLPAEIFLDDPMYERLMGKLLMVHMSVDEDTLRPIFEAQASRDEAMAAALVGAIEEAKAAGKDGEARPLAVVVCGAGHCQYGLGTPDRVARRLGEGEAQMRIVLMSESGDLELTDEERAMMREMEISHRDLEFIDRPVADYLHAVEPKGEGAE